MVDDERQELLELIAQVTTHDVIARRMRNITDRKECPPDMRDDFERFVDMAYFFHLRAA